MEVVCDHCGARLKIPDEKVPKDRRLALACPKCKEKIVVDARGGASRRPDEKKAPVSPPSPPLPDIREDAPDIGFYEEGVSLALVLGMDPEESPAMTLMPKMAIQNISEGPNLSAILARGGVKRMVTSIPNRPPIRELIKQIYRAVWDFPCCAIG